MSKRRSKFQINLPPVTQTLKMPPPPMATSASVKPEPYNRAFPNQMPAPLDTFMSNESMNIGFDGAVDSMMDWSFGMDDLSGNLRGQEQWVKATDKHAQTLRGMTVARSRLLDRSVTIWSALYMRRGDRMFDHGGQKKKGKKGPEAGDQHTVTEGKEIDAVVETGDDAVRADAGEGSNTT